MKSEMNGLPVDWGKLKVIVKRGRKRGKRISRKELGERLLRIARERGLIK